MGYEVSLVYEGEVSLGLASADQRLDLHALNVPIT